MKYEVHRSVDIDVLTDVVVNKAEPIVVSKVSHVLLRTGDQVVHAEDVTAALEKSIADVRADETGGAGDDRPGHVVSAARHSDRH